MSDTEVVEQKTALASLSDLTQEAAVIIAEATSYTCNTQDEFEMAAELLKRIKGCSKGIEEWRKESVAEPNRLVKSINAAAKDASDPLDKAEGVIKGGIALYMRREEDRRRLLQIEADKKRDAELQAGLEAQRIARDEAAALEAAADPEMVDTIEMLKAQAEAPIALPPAAPVQTMAPVSGVHMVETWEPVPTDPVSFGILQLQKVAAETLRFLSNVSGAEPETAALAAAIRACVPFEHLKVELRTRELIAIGSRTKGLGVIAGITFTSKSTIASRSK